MYHVLFLCTGNSARSQMAEALLEHLGAGRFQAESAGTEPAPRVNPGAIDALATAGIGWRGHLPRRVEELSPHGWDLVVTVCDEARESCPIFPPGPIIAHWGMPDPAVVEGDDATRRAAFLRALSVLRRRIGALIELPVEDLPRGELEPRIQQIGRIV